MAEAKNVEHSKERPPSRKLTKKKKKAQHQDAHEKNRSFRRFSKRDKDNGYRHGQ